MINIGSREDVFFKITTIIKNPNKRAANPLVVRLHCHVIYPLPIYLFTLLMGSFTCLGKIYDTQFYYDGGLPICLPYLGDFSLSLIDITNFCKHIPYFDSFYIS